MFGKCENGSTEKERSASGKNPSNLHIRFRQFRTSFHTAEEKYQSSNEVSQKAQVS